MWVRSFVCLIPVNQLSSGSQILQEYRVWGTFYLSVQFDNNSKWSMQDGRVILLAIGIGSFPGCLLRNVFWICTFLNGWCKMNIFEAIFLYRRNLTFPVGGRLFWINLLQTLSLIMFARWLLTFDNNSTFQSGGTRNWTSIVIYKPIHFKLCYFPSCWLRNDGKN